MSKSLYFFATSEDLLEWLSSVKQADRVSYFEAGVFESPDFARFDSAASIPDLGYARAGDQVRESRYLVQYKDVPIEVRPIPQRSGYTRYAIDQLQNPASVVFQPGGSYGDSVIIAGSLGTATTDEQSLALFRSFATRLKSSFTKVQSFWVGPAAQDLWSRGVRLTASLASPRDYDLKRSADS